jgi:hypothetical protein
MAMSYSDTGEYLGIVMVMVQVLVLDQHQALFWAPIQSQDAVV